MIDIHDEQAFERVIEDECISVMMFSANWCPDCMFIKPFIPGIEEKYKNLKFYLLNRDECMDIAIQYDVLGIPSFVCFKKGKEISRFVSTLKKTKEEIEAYLDKTIESGAK